MNWRDAIGRWFSRSTPTQAQTSPQLASSRLALPSPDPQSQSPANRDETGEKLIERLREATRHAGIQRDDPMMPLLTALANAIRYLGARTRESDRIAQEASRLTLETIQHARVSADAEAKRFRAELASTEADLISQVGSAIARTADQAFTGRVRVLDRNSILIATAVLVGTGAGCLGGGYHWGSTNARTDIHETEAGLQAAFSGGVDHARLWLDLMTWNNIGDALQNCSASGRTFTDQGRKACNLAPWVEPPPSTPNP